MSRREVLALAGATSVAALWPRPLSALARALGSSPLRVNGARLNEHFAALSAFGKNPQGGVTRRRLFRCRPTGARVGAVADARCRTANGDRRGRQSHRPSRRSRCRARKPILFGSHIDSVPEGGNYDGDVGSLSAIEVAKTLQENGTQTRHPLEVVIFQNEEGGLVGSRAISGELEAKELALVSQSGKSIGDGITFIGGDLTKLESVKRTKGDIAAYVELHIEQGGILEQTRTDIGVVEGIVGIDRWDVTIDGVANHAGTTPMDQRHDAMLTAARFTIAVNRIVTSLPGRQVGTIGRISAFPGAPNVIPGKVVLTLELRDLDGAKTRLLYDRIVAESKKIGAQNGTTFSFTETNVHLPALTERRIQTAITRVAHDLGLSTRVMPSGAGHDAQSMARLGPAGMIFVPSVSGISHAPKEFSRPKDIENGANVLLQTVLTLDAEIE